MASDFDVTGEDATDAATFEAQAREAFTDEKLPRALVLIDRAIELEPGSFDAWSFRAKILVALDRGDEALVSIDRALELEPQALRPSGAPIPRATISGRSRTFTTISTTPCIAWVNSTKRPRYVQRRRPTDTTLRKGSTTGPLSAPATVPYPSP